MTPDEAVQALMESGMPEADARTSLEAMHATPEGQPYGADAMRAAAILRNHA